jgi:hypothetical protein
MVKIACESNKTKIVIRNIALKKQNTNVITTTTS